MKHEIDIKQDYMQISKFTSSAIDIIVLYRSQSGNHQDLEQNLKELVNKEKPQLIIGDFNFCFLEKSLNPTKKYLEESDFSQLIKEPTHIEGNLLDQAHVRDSRRVHKYSAVVHSKYYSDHKGLGVLVKRGM